MLKMQNIVSSISLIILTVLSVTCATQEKPRTSGPYYFEGFAHYKIPFQPIKELTPSEAKSRDAYYIAYYSNDGKIISFRQFYSEVQHLG